MRTRNLGHDRRTFLKSLGVLAALGVTSSSCATAGWSVPLVASRKRTAGVVRCAFFYPPADVVLAGQNEDTWREHKWFTWPGNQFKPEEQQAKFTAEICRMAKNLDLRLVIDEKSIYTGAATQAFVADVQATKPDALLLFDFWNSFRDRISTVIDAYPGPIIVYHPLGANHQLPPERLMKGPRIQYIHSMENWDALERGLRSIHAKTRMAQSRLLRVSGQTDKESDEKEPFFNTAVHTVPAKFYNDLFDATQVTDEARSLAKQVRAGANEVMDLSENAFLDAARAHLAVMKIMEQYEADAITIQCLFLEHRKPCLSFALNNGRLIPCACENDLSAALTLMLGESMFDRGGFQHNPEFDTEENLYFGAHCTCTTRLHGPNAKPAPYLLRPFFHQMPKTLALDVQWPEGETVTLCKYHSDKKLLDAWTGEVVSSPTCPPTGGCATRVLVKVRDVPDVCGIYPGPHPVLFCGDFARQLKVFADLYELEIRTNA